MHQRDLSELLRAADAAAARPPVPADLAARIQRRWEIRRTPGWTRLAVTAAAAALLFVVIGGDPRRPARDLPGTAVRGVPESRVSQTAGVRDLRAELVTLDLEARSRLTVLHRTNELVRAAAITPRPAEPPDPVDVAAAAAERAAVALLHYADRTGALPDQQPGAIREYRRVIELFPQTAVAQVARDRLNKLQTNPGGSL